MICWCAIFRSRQWVVPYSSSGNRCNSVTVYRGVPVVTCVTVLCQSLTEQHILPEVTTCVSNHRLQFTCICDLLLAKRVNTPSLEGWAVPYSSSGNSGNRCNSAVCRSVTKQHILPEVATSFGTPSLDNARTSSHDQRSLFGSCRRFGGFVLYFSDQWSLVSDHPNWETTMLSLALLFSCIPKNCNSTFALYCSKKFRPLQLEISFLGFKRCFLPLFLFKFEGRAVHGHVHVSAALAWSHVIRQLLRKQSFSFQLNGTLCFHWPWKVTNPSFLHRHLQNTFCQSQCLK